MKSESQPPGIWQGWRERREGEREGGGEGGSEEGRGEDRGRDGGGEEGGREGGGEEGGRKDVERVYKMGEGGREGGERVSWREGGRGGRMGGRVLSEDGRECLLYFPIDMYSRVCIPCKSHPGGREPRACSLSGQYKAGCRSSR